MKDCKCRSLFSTSYPWAELSYILNDVVHTRRIFDISKVVDVNKKVQVLF